MNIFLKTIKLLIISICGTFFIGVSCSATEKKVQEFATVMHVIDGDSIEIRLEGMWKTIRLYGIDAPEWKQPYSKKAKIYLEKLLLGNEVSVEELYADKFNRSVALIYYRGMCINQLLVKEGLAWVHIYYCHKKICEYWKILEHQARNERIGLWHDRKPIPPWIWKRSKK